MLDLFLSAVTFFILEALNHAYLVIDADDLNETFVLSDL